MRRIVVYEHLSGGGVGDADAASPELAELLPQGVAMRDAVVADLARALRAGGRPWALSVAVDARWPASAASAADAGDAPAAHSGPGPAPDALGRISAVSRSAGLSPDAFLRHLAATHDAVWVIAPESDGVLAACRAAVAAVDPARWIGCDADAIATASSKSATVMRLAAHGIATPQALRAEARCWVVKPDDGAGSVDTWRFDDRAAAAAWAESRGGGAARVLEPWVDGEVGSLTVLARGGRAELLSINRQHVEAVPEAGRPGVAALHYRGVRPGVSPVDAPAAAPLRALAGAVLRVLPGLRGLVGIDVVHHPRVGPVVIEVNPRVTSAVVGLADRLGRSPAAQVLEEFGHG